MIVTMYGNLQPSPITIKVSPCNCINGRQESIGSDLAIMTTAKREIEIERDGGKRMELGLLLSCSYS